eukprot:5797144-Lingulodinium_polyedra.AAC.1
MGDVQRTGLVPPWAESDDLATVIGMFCQVAPKMRFDFMYLATGGLLLIGTGACIVEACLLCGGLPA